METARSKFKVFSFQNILFAVVTLLLILLIFLSSFLSHSNKNQGKTEIGVIGTVTAMYSSGNNGGLYLGMLENKLIAINEQNKQMWEYKIGGSVLDVKSHGEYIYISADDRNIYIINSSGDLLNLIQTSYRPMVADGNIHTGRIVSGNRLPPFKNVLQVFNNEGENVFSKKLDTGFNNVFFTANGFRTVYITDSAEIVLIDENGNELKTMELEYNAIQSVYDFDGSTIYVCDIGQNLYALDENLIIKWKINIGGKINSIAIDVENQTVVAATNDGLLHFFDIEGNEKFSVSSVNEIKQIRINNYSSSLYVLKGENELYHYDLTNLGSFAKMQFAKKFINIALIIVAILYLFIGLSVIPVFGDKFLKMVLGFLKAIYRSRVSYLIILPTILLLCIFNYFPAISGLVLAFTDYKPGVYMHWVGVNNFIDMLQNTYFWVGVGNMFLLLGTDVLKALIPPIIIAELIIAIRSSKAQYWTRVGLYLPAILPGVAGLLVWTNGILGLNGVLNDILRLFEMGDFARAWLGDSRTAIWGLVLINFPWVGAFIIFYGALINLPSSLFDSAKIDGCKWIRRIWSIDVPLILPQIKYIFVLSFIFSIQDFGRVYLTTMGGPGHSTYTPMLELYFNMSRFNNYGLAAAMGLFLFILVFGATLFNLKIKSSSDGIS